MKIDWLPLVEMMRSHDRFLLTSHQRADCDAIVSEMAAAAIEPRADGCDVRIEYAEDFTAQMLEYADRYAFLPSWN